MKPKDLLNVEQLGWAIRLKRKERGLSQAKLAELLGVERKWVVRLEAGNPKATLGLVLETLSTLGVRASLRDEDMPLSENDRRPAPSRIDEVFSRLQRPRST